MCGGHGIHHILDMVASDTTRDKDVQHHSGGHVNSSAVMEQQVKLMYARGDIGVETFHRLLDMAQAGELKAGDLTAFQSHRANVPLSVQREQHLRQESFSTHPDQLRQQRSQLEAACAETEESIRRLRLEAARLYQQAESAAGGLKEAAPESETVQALSRIREEALARARSVEERIGHIEERLSLLRSQLDELVVEKGSL